MAANALVDFFAEIGFQVDDKGLHKFEATMKDVGAQVAVLTGAITLAAGAVSGFIFKMAEGMDELNDFANLNNVNVEQLQRLQYAAEIMDGSAQAVTSSIAGLNSVIGQAATGVGRGALIMQKFGLHVRDANGHVKETSTVLEEIRGKMAKMGAAERISFADKMGIDRTLIPMLTDTTGKFEELIQESNDYISTAGELKEASDLMDDGIHRLKMQALGMSRAIASKLIPMFTMVIKKIQDFLKNNKKAIEEGLTKAIKVVLYLFTALYNVVDSIIKVGNGLAQMVGGWTNALTLLGIALGVILAYKIGMWVVALTTAMRGLSVATLAAAWPYILIGIGIMALIAIIEDLITWINGGESAFSSFYEAVAYDIQVLIQWFKNWWIIIQDVIGAVSDFANKVKGLLGFSSSLNVEPKQTTVNQAGKNVVANDNRNFDIKITTPDPNAAGKAVAREMANSNKATIRNGQGAVAY